MSGGEDSKAGVLLSPQMQEMALHHHQQQHHHQHPDGTHYDPARNHPLINSSPPILPNPMSALSQLNPQISRSALPHGSPSPPGSKSATPSPSSSNQEEETDPHSKVLIWQRFFWLVVVEEEARAWQCFSEMVRMLTVVLSLNRKRGSHACAFLFAVGWKMLLLRGIEAMIFFFFFVCVCVMVWWSVVSHLKRKLM